MATNENLPPNVIKQLAKELKSLDESPPEGIKLGVNDDDFSTIYADIDGPAGTTYESGVFRMKLLLSHDFPLSPPKGYFVTKIFHPNIALNGEICVNTLKKDWNPRLGLQHVLTVVRCLLIEPFPESSLNEQAGKLLLEDYEEYARHARLYTGIHAMKPKPKSKSGPICESTKALNVDQTNSSATLNADNKSSQAPGSLPSTPAAAKVVVAPLSEIGSNSNTLQKREISVADTKKIDSRKKRLEGGGERFGILYDVIHFDLYTDWIINGLSALFSFEFPVLYRLTNFYINQRDCNSKQLGMLILE